MAEAIEIINSQSGTDGTGRNTKRKMLYHVLGSDVDGDIKTAILAKAPALFSANGIDLVLDDISKTQIGPEFWAAEVSYIDPEKQEDKEKRAENTLVASWDTTGGTQHISTSLETRGSARRSLSHDPPENFGKAIEVTENGVNGTDVVVPLLRLELEYKFPNASVTDAYIRKLRDLTGTTNNGTFKGWEQGDLLFLGSSGRQATKGGITARFIFAAGKAITGSFGYYDEAGDPADLTKRAHDHLWYYFAREAGDESIVQRPKWLYIERVYEETDFAEIGIGT